MRQGYLEGLKPAMVKLVVKSKGKTVQVDGVVATGWPIDWSSDNCL